MVDFRLPSCYIGGMAPSIHPDATYIDIARVRRQPGEQESKVADSRAAFRVLEQEGRDRFGACELCKITVLRINRRTGKTMAHDVHHVDGNRKNSDPGNLLILCTRCHRGIEWALAQLQSK